MGDRLLQDLQSQITRGQAIFVVGAGVATSACGANPVASWTGLLESAICWCEACVSDLPNGWSDLIRGLVAYGDVPNLLLAAEAVTLKLGGRRGGEYRRWLHETVGRLEVVDPSVPEALAALNTPLVTTNYDGLLERATGRGTVTWREGPLIESVIRRDNNSIVHLHGFWQAPETVVFGMQSYDAVLGDSTAQALAQAMGSVRSLVLVGIGAGASDPNFQALRDWIRARFSGSEYRHFRLCLEHERESIAAEHRGERVVPIVYGVDHRSLARFLRRLSPCPTRNSFTQTLDPPVKLLPARRPTLGRSTEVAQLVANILAAPAVPTVVLGAPGIGKTNLCLAALHHSDVAGRFGMRRFLVRCEGALNASAIVAELNKTLGVPPGEGSPIAAAAAWLEDAPTALVLDSAEASWEPNTIPTEEVFAQLAAVPGVALVVNLRGAERPGGPRWASAILVDVLNASDSRGLFLSIAGERFDGPALADLLAEMGGGVPLAVELFAHTAEGEPGLESLASRWREERIQLLEKGTADHRLLSVAVSVEASCNGPLMREDARRLLSLLGMLPDGVAHAHLENLMPGAAAASANLLRRRGLAFDEGDRLLTYPPIRHHVAAAHPPCPADWACAAKHYRDIAVELGDQVGGPTSAGAVTALLAETANIEASLRAELASDFPAGGIDAVHALTAFAQFTRFDLTESLEVALSAAIRINDEYRTALVLFDRGVVAMYRSDQGAGDRLEQALAIYRRLGNVEGEAKCVLCLGDLALDQSDHMAARAYYNDARLRFRQVNSIEGEAACIERLGNVALDCSEHRRARHALQGGSNSLPATRQPGWRCRL